MSAVVCGLGGWLPPTIVTNEELCDRLDTTPEWIRSRTGIIERRVVSSGTATSDLAVEAGRRALRSAGFSTVGAVVLATTSPDRLCPASGPEVATRLGLVETPAFDVDSACSGFVYGLATGVGLISAGVSDSVLLIGAEAFSTLVNPADRTTATVFGDGAGALVLRRGRPDEPGSLDAFDLGADGEHSDLLAIPAGGSRQRSATGLGHGDEADWYLHMAGRAVYQQAVARMRDSTRRVLERTGCSASDVDVLAGHQANIRILEALAERLGLPGDRIVSNIDRVGNTLAASIPLLLDTATNGNLIPGDRVLITAFGAGLSWGSTLLTWPDLFVQPVDLSAEEETT
ncbi:3-oxoacyl-[acyl-carrier-protein] synthase-3 [Actinopolyspora alba]|uniref:Beta-ketoacyl-[acyl-carrier-protein] synthase III n=1 Tax=Actinopolyspora alba TaxID=673379 RepID=A0A1I1UV41_9ACTN|nr:beta-ketoacyl-ACP synthase III [Actinopolyspora alba]SFD72723.1 3-oxoacyl-[acyl-carrier-protein] synthase-3 [Actinopolyspora alba]